MKRRLGWRTETPRYQRTIDVLTISPKLTISEIAERIHCCLRSAQEIIKLLKGAEKVHIGGWVRNKGKLRNHTLPLWVAGPGKDAKRPAPLTPEQLQQRRKHRLIAQFGPDLARKIIQPRTQGGSEVISYDGHIYRRGAPRGIRSAA